MHRPTALLVALAVVAGAFVVHPALGIGLAAVGAVTGALAWGRQGTDRAVDLGTALALAVAALVVIGGALGLGWVALAAIDDPDPERLVVGDAMPDVEPRPSVVDRERQRDAAGYDDGRVSPDEIDGYDPSIELAPDAAQVEVAVTREWEAAPVHAAAPGALPPGPGRIASPSSGFANVRARPTTASDLRARLPDGAPVTIADCGHEDANGVWCRLEAGDVTGWVVARYLATAG